MTWIIGEGSPRSICNRETKKGKIWNIVRDIEKSLLSEPQDWAYSMGIYNRKKNININWFILPWLFMVMWEPQWFLIKSYNKRYLWEAIKKWKRIVRLK